MCPCLNERLFELHLSGHVCLNEHLFEHLSKCLYLSEILFQHLSRCLCLNEHLSKHLSKHLCLNVRFRWKSKLKTLGVQNSKPQF
jgi:hypothetical protein